MWQIPLAPVWIGLIVAIGGVIGYYLGTAKQKKLARVVVEAIADGIITAAEILVIVVAGKDVYAEIMERRKKSVN